MTMDNSGGARRFARHHLVGLIAMMLVSALGLVTAPASDAAAKAGEVTLATDGLAVYPSGCGRAYYHVDVSPLAYDWVVDVDVWAPDGSWAGGGYHFNGGDPNAIDEDIYLCDDYDPRGTYTVEAKVEIRDASSSLVDAYVLTDSFRFERKRLTSSNLTRTLEPLRAHSWKITGQLNRAGEAWTHKRVELQVLFSGTWRNVKAKVTDRRGVAIWTSTPERGAGAFRLRLYAAGNTSTKPAVSREFRVTAR